MKNIRVKELMTLTVDYPSVSRKATVREALLSFERGAKRFERKGGKPSAVLVLDENKHVIGKLTAWDILRALEPKYKSIGHDECISHYGWTAAFIKSMVANYGLLQDSLRETCNRSSNIEVGEIMTPVDERDIKHHEKQIIDDEACLNEAVHLFVMGNFMSLFVRRKGEIIGILRLVDVLNFIAAAIKECPVKEEE